MSRSQKVLIFICLFYQTFAYSQILHCPTAEEIKHNEFHQWLPLYIEGEELASDEDVKTFTQQITQFQIARWDTNYLENAHCFYQGNHPMMQKIILAHNAWRPIENPYWHWVAPNKLAECTNFNPDNCGFIE